jgi:hypothetical protein
MRKLFQTPLHLLILFIWTVNSSSDLYAQNETQNPVSAFWKTNGNTGLNSGSNFLGTTTNVSLRVRTNNIERMVVDSTGNVGIGTASPSQKLDVVGNLKLSQAFMPGGSAGTSGQFLLSGGANAAPTWSPFTIGNPTATSIIAKYYASLSWNGNWSNGATRTWTVTDPDCKTSSCITISFTGVNTLLNNIEINGVQTGNGSFVVSMTNNTGGNLQGSVGIAFIAFY